MRNKWNGWIVCAALCIQTGMWIIGEKLFYGAYRVAPFLLLCLVAQGIAIAGWIRQKAPARWEKRAQLAALGLSVILCVCFAPRYTMDGAIAKVRQETGMQENVYSMQADPKMPVVAKPNSPRYALNTALYCIRATGQSLTYWTYFDPATGEYRMQTVMDADASEPAG